MRIWVYYSDYCATLFLNPSTIYDYIHISLFFLSVNQFYIVRVIREITSFDLQYFPTWSYGSDPSLDSPKTSK